MPTAKNLLSESLCGVNAIHMFHLDYVERNMLLTYAVFRCQFRKWMEAVNSVIKEVSHVCQCIVWE